MNTREKQLLERDVRRGNPELNPGDFLNLYMKSNFPQTAAMPNLDQKEMQIIPQTPGKEIEYNKKPLQGTSFDNPKGR